MDTSRAKGQGAMEYLMTYGWAVAVVLIVVLMMWRVGVLDFGSQMAPTSTGFTTIKPLLLSCEMTGESNDAIWQEVNGNTETCEERGGSCSGIFRCIFINGAGSTIKIIKVNISTPYGQCERGRISINEDVYDSSRGNCAFGPHRLYSDDPSDVKCCPGYDEHYMDRDPDDGTNLGCFMAKPNEQFYVLATGCPPDLTPCNPAETKVGEPYTAYVTITYNITMGELWSEVSSSGTVRGTRVKYTGYEWY